MTAKRIAFGITGASGAVYGVDLLRRLLAEGCEIALCVSGPARQVLREEMDLEWTWDDPDWRRLLGDDDSGLVTLYREDQIGAPPASGSTPFDGYVICPCSMGTIGRLAAGTSENLINRMADVALKERLPLVLVPRETPLSPIHLRNMLTLSEAGAVILPACPGFYERPKSVEDLVGFVGRRVLQHLGV